MIGFLDLSWLCFEGLKTLTCGRETLSNHRYFQARLTVQYKEF